MEEKMKALTSQGCMVKAQGGRGTSCFRKNPIKR